LDKTIKVWDLHGNCLKTLSEHSRYVNCVAINADSSIIASGSNDKSVIIWDLTNTFTLDSHLTGLRSLLFTLASNQVDIPLEFICPITHEIMVAPVIADDGFTYEKNAIEKWFERDAPTSPMTNMPMTNVILIGNQKLKEQIENYLKDLDFDPFN
jgi:U-box domain/WD domain, G-beta repeat